MIALGILFSAIAFAAEPAPSPKPDRFKHAYFRFECGPRGGGAIRFYFLPARTGCENFQAEYLTFATYEDGSTLFAPKKIEFKGRSREAGGQRCDRQGKCEEAAAGKLFLEQFDEDKRGTGRFELRFKDGAVETGRFEAERCPSRMYCR